MSEAMAYFQIVANHYDKAGDTKASLDTLKKMVDLDPDNVASRIKLAELYARENMNERGARRSSSAPPSTSSATTARTTTCASPSASPRWSRTTSPLAKELAAVYLQRGDQKRALAKLQVCFKADPRDVETLKLLAQAFQGAGPDLQDGLRLQGAGARSTQDKGRTRRGRRASGPDRRAGPEGPGPARERARARSAGSAPARRRSSTGAARRAPAADAGPCATAPRRAGACARRQRPRRRPRLPARLRAVRGSASSSPSCSPRPTST